MYEDEYPVLIEDPISWEGYVISSDATSNLFGEIHLQDRLSLPQGGLVLLTDMPQTHTLLPVGARVSLKLQGLYMGETGGSYQLGGAFHSFGNINVGRLPAAILPDHIKVKCDHASDPVAIKVQVEHLSDSHLNTLVEIQGVEFVSEEVGKPYANNGEVTRRTLVDCTGNRLFVRNSGFSDFKSDLLPDGHGTALGILTKYKNQYELLIRDTEELQLNEARCETRIRKESSKSILISELADPDNLPEARFIELFNASDSVVVLNGWKLLRFTNDNPQPGPELLLDGLEIDARKALVISAYPEEFKTTYGFAPDAIAPRNGPSDSNGDDSIELVDPFGNIMDVFGFPGIDGSGTAHEFEDGRALRRIGVNESNPMFNLSEWEVYNDTGGEGSVRKPQNAPEDFSPGNHGE